MYKLFRGRFPYCLRDIKHIPRALKYRVQRAFKGWAPCDTWNIDCWFMEVMPQMLRYLKENKHSYPVYLTEKEWDNILEYMAFLLDEMDETKCSQQNEIWNEYFNSDRSISVDREAALARDEEIANYRYKCKDEFFKLFNKYFYDLWD